jgi:hypothetical protein
MQALMAQNKSLRIDSLSLVFSTIWPQLFALFGVHPAYWDAGKVATEDTVRQGLCLFVNQGISLCAKAAEESVGARKEFITIGYVVQFSVQFMGLRSTNETAEMHHRLLETKWGKDGSALTASWMEYRFDRHFMISQGIGIRHSNCLYFSTARGVAEYCGDVQQMVQIHEKQLGAMQEFTKRGVPGEELAFYFLFAASSCTGLGLKALHPSGKGVLALMESCEGRCSDPSECEEWYGSPEWGAFVGRFGDGKSSKDGLHHMFLKPTVITTLQAILSLCLASGGSSNFDLTWLDNLPAADDSKLHDGVIGCWSFANPRVLIAEVLEWQGRHKEAIRCRTHMFLLITSHSCVLTPPPLIIRSFAAAELQAEFNFNAASKVRSGNVLGRCHAALGEHALSVSAFDAAIDLVKRGRFLLAEALLIRDRALAGQGAGKSTMHWDEQRGGQRLAEVMGRMQGGREPLELLLATE